MKKLTYILFMAILLSACEKKNDDLVTPNVEQNFPQILMLADEGDGELEDEDKFSFKITLADRVDPTGQELAGKIIPLQKEVTVNFEISNFEGFNSINSYIKDAEAFYEIDDCTTSADKGIDLKLVFDKTTGKGSVTFPKDVEEIEIEFETDDSLFDDDIFNDEERKLEIRLTGVNSNGQNVVVNDQNTFEYIVLDDDGIYGEYELDLDDQQEFNSFKQLFGLVNEDVKSLNLADIEEIKMEVEYGEVKAVVVLKETEQIDDCGKLETVNKEIEIECDLEELEADKLSGDLEFTGKVENESKAEKEFTYKGSFKLIGKTLELKLKGEFDDEKTASITLKLNK